MTTYTCKTCGKISDKEGHLCDPTGVGEVYVCKSCGQQAKKKKHLCKPKVRSFNIFVAVAAEGR